MATKPHVSKCKKFFLRKWFFLRSSKLSLMYFTVPAVTKCRNDSRHKSENFTHVHISSTLHFIQNMEKQNKGEEKATTTKTSKQANRKENNTIQARSDQTESQQQYVDQIIRNCRSRIFFFLQHNDSLSAFSEKIQI